MVTSIHIIAQEQVLCFGWWPTLLEQLQQVEELSMDVSTNSDVGMQSQYIGFLHEDVSEGGAQQINFFFCQDFPGDQFGGICLKHITVDYMINIWLSRIRCLTTGSLFSIRNAKESEFLLKHYIANRFSMSGTDIAGLFTNLCRHHTNQDDPRLINLRTAVKKSFSGFEITDRIRIAWALTKMKDRELAVEILDSVKPKTDELTINELAAILWILAKIESKDLNLFIKAQKRMKQMLEDPSVKMSAPDIAETRNMSEYSPLSLVQTIWAISDMGFSDKDMFDVVVKSIMMEHLERFNTRMLIIAMYSCVKSRYKRKFNERLYEEIKKRKDNLSQESVLTLKLLVETCAKIKSYDREFFEQLIQIIISKHTNSEMSTKFSSQILKAMSDIGVMPDGSVRYLVEAFTKRCKQANDIDCNMVLRVISHEPWSNQYPDHIKMISDRAKVMSKGRRKRTVEKQIEEMETPYGKQ